MSKITICAHCGKIGFSDRGWGRICKSHAIETTENNIIRDDGGKRVLFYDPNVKMVKRVRAEREEWRTK